jgi:hypothetical protein
MVIFVEKLIRVFGEQMAQQLKRIPVNLNFSLSENPTVDFINRQSGRPYSHAPISETGLYLCTKSSTEDKRRSLQRLVTRLDFPPDGVEVLLV